MAMPLPNLNFNGGTAGDVETRIGGKRVVKVDSSGFVWAAVILGVVAIFVMGRKK